MVADPPGQGPEVAARLVLLQVPGYQDGGGGAEKAVLVAQIPDMPRGAVVVVAAIVGLLAGQEPLVAEGTAGV